MEAATSALYRKFRETAARHPRQPALTFLGVEDRPDVTYTYERLFACAEELGERLAAHGLGRDGPVGLLLRTQEEQTLHYLAGLHAGVVPAILTPPNRKLSRDYYRETMTAVLRKCRFSAVVTDVEGIDLPTRGLAPRTFEPLPSADDTPAQPALDAEMMGDASFMQFSSGTTGIKRGVLVSDEAVLAQLEAYSSAIGLHDGDRILSWLPLYHDMGFIACLNMPLSYGVHTVMIDPIRWVGDPSSYLRAASEYRATLSWHPNFAFAFMGQRVADADLADVDLSSLRGLVNCSEPVTHESQQTFLHRFGSHGLARDVFKGCYAMAETTFALTHGEPDHPAYLDPVGPVDGTRSPSPAGYVSVGTPLPGVELAIVDPDDGAPLPDRMVGEIWTRSPFTFTGYFNQPDATSEALTEDGWYRTGDLGYRVDDAYYVAGRRKDVLIVGGVNVFPQDLEDLAGSVEGVQPGRASAFSTFDPRVQSERIVILAEADRAGQRPEQEVRVEIRQRVLAALQVANFSVEIVPPGWLVKSTSGKMARAANRDKWRTTTD